MTDPERPDPTRHEPVPGDSTDEELTWSSQESPLVPPDWMVGPIPPPVVPPGPPPSAASPAVEAAPSYPYAVQPAAPIPDPVAPYVAPSAAPTSRPPMGLGWLWWLAGGCALLLLCCMCAVLLSLVSVAVGMGPSRLGPGPAPLPPTATPRPPASVNPSEAPAAEAAPARPSSGPIGQAATDFTVTTLDGQTMKLSDFRGHPVVLNFWASWCGPCREEMPLLSKTYEEQKDSGLVVLAVNVQESAATARRYAEQNKLPFTIALDEKGEISGLYRVRSLPTTYFIDAEGVIQSWQTGTLSKMLLDRHLDRIR